MGNTIKHNMNAVRF